MVTNNYELLINAPLSKVWETLTDSKLNKAWMKNIVVETDWQAGSPIKYTCLNADGSVMQWQGKAMIWEGIIETITPMSEFTCIYPSQRTGIIKESYLLKNNHNQTVLQMVQDCVSDAVATGYKDGTQESLEMLKRYLQGQVAYKVMNFTRK